MAGISGAFAPKGMNECQYARTWGPTLFGTWGVQLSWGRLGTNRHQQGFLESSSEEEAFREAASLVERGHRRV